MYTLCLSIYQSMAGCALTPPTVVIFYHFDATADFKSFFN
jgi:hypothetical protein